MSKHGNMKRSTKANRFLGIPYAVLQSENYKQLTSHGVKLLVDIGGQFNGRNNGDLCATLSYLRRYGWSSSSTLAERIDELLHYGFIEKTRQGGRHKCSLYAITWKPINECKTKLDIKETSVASNRWKHITKKWIPKRNRTNQKCGTEIESIISNCTAGRTIPHNVIQEVHRRSN